MKRILSILLLSMTFMSLTVPAPHQNTRLRLKALMLYQFATQIDWPSEYKNGSFVIGIYGDPELYTAVKKAHSSKAVGSQPLKILKFDKESDITKTHILFIGTNKSNAVKKLANKYKNNSTLVISEYDSGLEDGAIINFIVTNNQNRYELSKTNANKHNLVINSKIIGYAIGVK